MPITIVPYDPTWPARFDAAAAQIRDALGAVTVRVEHVGSTSVPGLAAKPIVDIQLSVPAFAPESAYRAPLESLGYVFRPDDEPEHRFFYRLGPNGKTSIHIHVCELGSAWEARHVRFRDFFRADAELAAEYERVKRELAAQFDDGNAYADAKTPFITGVHERVGRATRPHDS